MARFHCYAPNKTPKGGGVQRKMWGGAQQEVAARQGGPCGDQPIRDQKMGGANQSGRGVRKTLQTKIGRPGKNGMLRVERG